MSHFSFVLNNHDHTLEMFYDAIDSTPEQIEEMYETTAKEMEKIYFRDSDYYPESPEEMCTVMSDLFGQDLEFKIANDSWVMRAQWDDVVGEYYVCGWIDFGGGLGNENLVPAKEAFHYGVDTIENKDQILEDVSSGFHEYLNSERGLEFVRENCFDKDLVGAVDKIRRSEGVER